MYSELNTEKIIKDRMLNNITNDVDKSEGSFTNDIISVVSNELEQGYIELDTVLSLVFAQTTYGEYLDRRAGEYGIVRKSGVKASGIVRFFGNDGVVIPIGITVSTNSELKYITTVSGIISGGFVDINVEAENVGSIYNVPANTVNLLPQLIIGVTSVNNVDIISGGVDIESDYDLLNRLLIKVQTPATSGNANHYKLWALEVAGIGDVKVFPTWSGGGTVKVVVIDSNKLPVSASKVMEVFDYIETQRPIGVAVTVESALGVSINISATIAYNKNYTIEQVNNNIINNVTNYLKQIAFIQNYVSYGVIGSLILDSEGVIDYTNLLVNNGTSNVVIGDSNVAVRGTVTLAWE